MYGKSSVEDLVRYKKRSMISPNFPTSSNDDAPRSFWTWKKNNQQLFNNRLLLMTSESMYIWIIAADRIFQVDWWNDIKLETQRNNSFQHLRPGTHRFLRIWFSWSVNEPHHGSSPSSWSVCSQWDVLEVWMFSIRLLIFNPSEMFQLLLDRDINLLRIKALLWRASEFHTCSNSSQNLRNIIWNPFGSITDFYIEVLLWRHVILSALMTSLGLYPLLLSDAVFYVLDPLLRDKPFGATDFLHVIINLLLSRVSRKLPSVSPLPQAIEDQLLEQVAASSFSIELILKMLRCLHISSEIPLFETRSWNSRVMNYSAINCWARQIMVQL